MFTTTISIGRNFGSSARPELVGQEMSEQLWANFEDEVHEVVTKAAQAIESAGWESNVAVFRGESVWSGETEDSIIFQLLTTCAHDQGSIEIYELYLFELADTYGQDAIAVVWNAEATLVGQGWTLSF